MDQVGELVRQMDLDSLREMVLQMQQTEPTIEQEVAMIQKASDLLHLRERLHRVITGEFHSRMPDLESLITDFESYARAALHLSTNDDVSPELTSLLTPQQVVALNLAIPNLGPKITNTEFASACQFAIDAAAVSNELSAQATRIIMHFAPNLCELVGAEIAALLVSFAGGLLQLAQTASCNIKSLGAKRTELLGYSSRSTGNFHGVAYNSEIVVTTPPEFREVVFRDLVNKIALVTRIDAAGERRDGSYGRDTREKIMERLDKRMNNTTPKVVRPLPVPGLEKKVNRGGRQKRAMKKKFGMGEELTARNKVVFGVGGQYDELGEQYGITALRGFRKQAAAVDAPFQKKIDKKLKAMEK